MYTITLALVLAISFLNSVLLVDAGLYVIKPSLGSKCHGGQKCTLEWLDDGVRPLLTAIGVCTVGLYTGKQQLVQELQPVDVSIDHSITFTPNPRAGPNSDTYYISIVSTSFTQTDNTTYAAFSPFFSIDQMSGSFQSPLASATSSKPLPSSPVHSDLPTGGTGSILSTITVGTLSTFLPTSDVLSSTRSSPSPSRMMTSTSPPFSSSTSTSSASSASSPSFTSPPLLFSTSSSTSSSTSTLTTSTVTGTGTSGTLAPPVSTTSSGALSIVPISILSALSVSLVLSFLF